LQNGEFCLLRREFQQFLTKEDQEQSFFINVLYKKNIYRKLFSVPLLASVKIKPLELLKTGLEIY
jgi:hypothetical protein